MRTYNINQTYVDENDPLTVILSTAEFLIWSTTNRFKGYSLDQLIFGRDMILLIKNKVDW